MIEIKNEELVRELIGELKSFPKYTRQLINLANQNAQGTRPRVVGQMTELIKECPEKTYDGWKKWYISKYSDRIENAIEKINQMVENLKNAIELIDKPMIQKWVEELVFEQTFIGLRVQEAILKKVASVKRVSYRMAKPEEESKGIDGFIGNTPVSIKPDTYKTKNALREEIKSSILFYKKTKSGLEIDANELLTQ